MMVKSEKYQGRVLSHLRRNRPKQASRERAAGTLDETVQDYAEQIANWVNSQLPSEEFLKDMSPLDRQRELNSTKMFAESDAMREVLPRDEASDGLIGPNGGYVDRLADEEDDY